MNEGCPLAGPLTEILSLTTKATKQVIDQEIKKMESLVRQIKLLFAVNILQFLLVLGIVIGMAVYYLSKQEVGWLLIVGEVVPVGGLIYIGLGLKKGWKKFRDAKAKLVYWQTYDFTVQDASDFNPLAPPTVH